MEWWRHLVTSNDISSSFRRVARACIVHQRVEEKLEIQVARATSVESHISSIGRSVVNMANRTARVANGWATHEEILAVRGKDPETQATRVGACERDRRPNFSGFADRRAMRSTWCRVWLWSNRVSRFLMTCGDILETTEAHGGAWQGFGWPDFWVLVTRGCGAYLLFWFRQAKLRFA